MSSNHIPYILYLSYIIILQHIQSSIHSFLPLKINLCAPISMVSLVGCPRFICRSKTHKDNYLQIFQHDEVHRPFRQFFCQPWNVKNEAPKKIGCRHQISAKAEGSQGNCVGEGCFCLGETEVPGTKSLMNEWLVKWHKGLIDLQCVSGTL